ncbi:MAG: helix-turn-helix transcriptional regulator [Bdellovibrionaceae bacterium]|nr:helix-turn-helix transcriptional regulator [Pseudobdellovibrionaceae bacterium]
MKRQTKSNNIFSKNLAGVLDDRNLSAKQGAKLAGVPSSTFTAWSNGSAAPLDLEAVHRFCQATQTDFEWLLTGNRSKQQPKLEDFFEAKSGDPILSGIYQIEVKPLKLRK